MAKLVAQMRLIAGALALAFIVAISVPASAQQINPTADAVKEQQLLDQLKVIQGRVTIPDEKSGMLVHPAGREWRQFHTVTLKWIGGISIIGMLAVLVLFYLWRGPMRVIASRSAPSSRRRGAFTSHRSSSTARRWRFTRSKGST